MRPLLQTTMVLAVALLAGQAAARVSPEQAARLDGDLTPLGGERAGSADGTIPSWIGGITEFPPGYDRRRQHVDPYAEDPVVLTITAANMDEHLEHLSPGQRALLERHPDSWHMQIYPTRRSASYPDFVYQAARANALNADFVSTGKGAARGSSVTSPFPIPNSGVEVVWNHTLRWRGVRVSGLQGRAAVTRQGNYQLLLQRQDIFLPYAAKPGEAVKAKFPGILAAIKGRNIEPALVSGNGSLVIEPIDQTTDPRKAWAYRRNTRQVLRLPYFAYDFPGNDTDGLRTVDDFWQFNGPTDRYDWVLKGKREMYVPYNAYRLHSDDVGDRDIVGPKHIKPGLARYELHRVWVVEGTLKAGASHRYARRTLYIDEDTWHVLMSDRYDASGQLWRTSEAHPVNFYNVPVMRSTLDVFYDLLDGRYFVEGLNNKRRPLVFEEEGDPREFSPNALRYFVR